MMMSLTTEVTILPKAPPDDYTDRRSTTLPRHRKLFELFDHSHDGVSFSVGTIVYDGFV